MQQPISFYLPLILTAVGGLTYHLAQKTMPTGVSPLVLLAATFATALTLCLLLASLDQTSVLALEAIIQLVESGPGRFSGHDRGGVLDRVPIGVETEPSSFDVQRSRGNSADSPRNRSVPGTCVLADACRNGALHQRIDAARQIDYEAVQLGCS
jgi:hypothetical protein